MRWPEYSIWWQVYPLGFLGAEKSGISEPQHRLPALADRLDHLLELGCNGLALGPVFAAETHGYDTVDHFRVDPRLGTEDDLKDLIDRAAAKGVRVLLDGVFNHVGRNFRQFVEVANGGDTYADWFVREGDDFRTFEGHQQLVALNHASPAVADYVTDVLNHWLDRGVDGWRLDAAYAVPLRFWRKVTDRAREKHPDAWFSGEVIHGDYTSYVTEGGLDSVTQYELWKAIWSSLNDVNPHELAWALTRHNDLLATFAPQTFVGNHDVTRIASRLTEPRHLPHALAVLFTVGGIPSVYYGDERAWRGVKEEREGGDDAIRPAWDDRGDDKTQRLHQLLIGIRRRHAWLVRTTTEVHSLGDGVLSYTLSGPDAAVAVALNFGAEQRPATVPARAWQHEAGDATIDAAGNAMLPAYGWVVATA